MSNREDLISTTFQAFLQEEKCACEVVSKMTQHCIVYTSCIRAYGP